MSNETLSYQKSFQSQASEIATDLVIVGSSISGLMTATYLKQKIPELNVIVIGPEPEQEKRVYVGESLTEISIHFFWEIGLKNYLDRTHNLKNGLTFYHKLRINDPKDPRYSVHAPGESLYYLSRQLNRPIFDRDLRHHAAQAGVQFLIGQAKEVEIGHGKYYHQLVVTTPEGKQIRLAARWLVDATGQKRLIGKQVTTYTRPNTGQRSAFWFRLADFQPFLQDVELSMRRPLEYNVWHSTHHFLGCGNWIWCIPLQDKERQRLISVGLTYRPDLYNYPLRTIDDFLVAVQGEHPAIADMVRSGQVLDVQTYHNYLYSAEQVYSPDGWFLVGDAARTVDPLYSTGLAMTALQIQQVTEIIRRELAEDVTADDIAALSSLWCQITTRRQRDITDQYATMHDPFSAHLRRYWNLNGWWNAILPLWWNGFLTAPEGARVLLGLLKGREESDQAAWNLFGAVSSQLDEVEQADFDKTFDFDQIINRRFDRSSASISQQLSQYFHWRVKMRLRLLKRVGWQYRRPQIRPILQEYVSMLAIKYLFHYKFQSLLQKIKPPLNFGNKCEE